MNSIVVNFNKEVQDLQSSEPTKDTELQAYKAEEEEYKARIEAVKAQLNVCMAVVANAGSSKYPLLQRGIHRSLPLSKG